MRRLTRHQREACDIEIRRRREAGETYKAIAADVGLGLRQVFRICNPAAAAKARADNAAWYKKEKAKNPEKLSQKNIAAGRRYRARVLETREKWARIAAEAVGAE